MCILHSRSKPCNSTMLSIDGIIYVKLPYVSYFAISYSLSLLILENMPASVEFRDLGTVVPFKSDSDVILC